MVAVIATAAVITY